MDKLQMAMRFAEIMLIEHFKGNEVYSRYGYKDGICEDAWVMADAMQAEADKRKSKPELPSLQQTFIDGVEQPRYAPSCDEWQPDWSQAPEWVSYWLKTSGISFAWVDRLPRISNLSDCWNLECMKKRSAPSFNYQGNWQDSLRKRPQ